MTATLPIGWGSHPTPKAEFDAARKVQRAARELPPEASPRDCRRKSRGAPRGRNAQCLMHMRFALYMQRQKTLPLPDQTCDALGINYETARRLLQAWQTLQEETP